MSEALVSIILGEITKIIYEELQQGVQLVTGMGKIIQRLRRNFVAIHTLLDDAEERQMDDKSIKIWLESLKEVCYDMEDVLDEQHTALWKMQLVKADQRIFSLFEGKVCRPFLSCFCCGQVVHHRRFAFKIKDIDERLDVIAAGKDRYQLIPKEVRQPGRVETTSFTEVSNLHGRDEEKTLIDSLLCPPSDEKENGVKTISIVGMGGIGKTALARLVFNDGAVMTHFDKQIWVFVSEVLDLSRVAKAIIMGLADPDHPSAPTLDSFTLQGLLEKIRRDIQGKKVFLVLDDVWTAESERWESLNQVLNLAASGSRILVTTQKDRVVQAMKSFRVHLGPLSKDACWKILSQEAFVERDKEQCENLEDFGKEIAGKCSGFPLAAKTLGSMLRSKETGEEWTCILNREIWKLDLEAVFAPLLVSYFDLPSAVRRCFLYCSIFPKGVEIERDGLIYQWMAQGYLSSDQNCDEMETTGVEYFDCLVERSFFQTFQLFEDGSTRTCKIHDIVLAFARFLMRKGNEFELTEVNHSDQNVRIELSSEKTRHLSVILAANACIPTSLVGAENLRSLSIFKSDHAEEDKIGNLFIQPKHLRSLVFRGGNINGFPEEVGELMHLKLLDLSGSSLKRLPEAICQLCNLQSLCLQRCSLEMLPDNIEKLLSLRYLDTTGSDALTYYPKGIGRLTSLRKLVGVVVSCDHNENKKFTFGDLENLSSLRFLALIVDCHHIDTEVGRAKLNSKTHLKHLNLGGPWVVRTRRADVIRVLSPPKYTKVTLV